MSPQFSLASVICLASLAFRAVLVNSLAAILVLTAPGFLAALKFL